MLTIVKVRTMAGHDHIGKKTFFFHVGKRFSYPNAKKENETVNFH